MNKEFDVIIAGAGPAGATAGLVLARKGLDVLILEKKNFPRFKLCGGMLTRKVLELGQSILPGFLSAMESRGIIEKKIDAYAIKTPDRLLYQGNANHSFILVNREKYDYLWMEQALEAGAKVFIDPVVRVDIQDSSVITSGGEKYQGKFIIGADGSGSRIRKTLSQKNIVQPPRSENSAMALETFVQREAGTFMDYPELILGLVKDGYAWSFPGSRLQVVGICSSRLKNGRELKSRLMGMLARQGVINPEEYNIQAHFLPYGDYEKKPGFKNVLLIGDAAGLAEPLLGEGIYYAHVSGILSARAVLNCMNNTDQGSEIYARYLAKIISSMSKRLLFRKMTLGMPPALAELSYRFMLPLIAPALEDRIHGKHFKLVS
jgi:menaquinone-9 beta-reductase